MQTSRNTNHLGRRLSRSLHDGLPLIPDFAKYESSWPPAFFCCLLVSHSNKSVKKPLTFSSIARASSSDSRCALRGCQTSRVRLIRLSSAFFIRNHRALQRRRELRRVQDRLAGADDRRMQSLPKP